MHIEAPCNVYTQVERTRLLSGVARMAWWLFVLIPIIHSPYDYLLLYLSIFEIRNREEELRNSV